MLIGLHGAGMTNMMFMKPGSTVVEIAGQYDGRMVSLPIPLLYCALTSHDHRWLAAGTMATLPPSLECIITSTTTIGEEAKQWMRRTSAGEQRHFMLALDQDPDP